MKVVADICIIPIKDAESLAADIATCQKLLQASGLKHTLHACGTNIEGGWDEVMTVIKSFHETLHEQGVSRINSTIKIGTRIDGNNTIEGKIKRVNDLIS